MAQILFSCLKLWTHLSHIYKLKELVFCTFSGTYSERQLCSINIKKTKDYIIRWSGPRCHGCKKWKDPLGWKSLCLLVSPSYSLSTVLHLTFFCSSPYPVSFSSSLCQCTHLSDFCLLHPLGVRLSAHVLLTISLYICASLAATRKVIHLSKISPLSIKQPHPKLSKGWILKYCCLLQSFSVQLNCSVKDYLYFGCPSLSFIHPVPSYGLIKVIVFALALYV